MPASDDLYVNESTFGVYRGGHWVYLTAQQFAIFSALRTHKSMPIEPLIHAVYGHDSDGGPEDPRTTIYVQVNRANKRLGAIGLAIQRDRKGSWFSHYRIHVL
jgi:DNA-binding response OmpR family regulator